MKYIKRSRKATNAILIVLFCVAMILGFWYWQNYTFTCTKVTVATAKVIKPLTIVQVSDLHGATYGKNNCYLLDAIKQQKPDLICVTGDMYTNGDTAGMDTAISFMSEATILAPVYFVAGEHDGDEQYLSALSNAGVQVLSYSTDSLTINGNHVTMYGIDNVYYSDTFNLFREFDEPHDDSLNILLAHIPNFEAFNWFGPDLTLCGDTHGGVAQLPLVGPLYFDGTFLPELSNGEEYVTDKGLFETYTGHVYVSGGLGNYPYPIRMFNRPEVSVLHIVPEE